MDYIHSPSTFRLPSRVVTSDSRRETWIAELANPVVPISKLAKSVPHGYRNEKLLQMLLDRDVPLSRAVWYIRTNGATEIVSPSPTSAQLDPRPQSADPAALQPAAIATRTASWLGLLRGQLRARVDRGRD